MALSRLRSLWRNLSQRDRVERELDAELQATLDLLIDEKVAARHGPAGSRAPLGDRVGRCRTRQGTRP